MILSRLFFIQVLKGAEYKEIAQRQQQLHIQLDAKRGTIYDRNGRALVINLPVESLESEYPLIVEQYSLIQDSGGSGKFRGGMGDI